MGRAAPIEKASGESKRRRRRSGERTQTVRGAEGSSGVWSNRGTRWMSERAMESIAICSRSLCLAAPLRATTSRAHVVQSDVTAAARRQTRVRQGTRVVVAATGSSLCCSPSRTLGSYAGFAWRTHPARFASRARTHSGKTRSTHSTRRHAHTSGGDSSTPHTHRPQRGTTQRGATLVDASERIDEDAKGREMRDTARIVASGLVRMRTMRRPSSHADSALPRPALRCAPHRIVLFRAVMLTAHVSATVPCACFSPN